MRAGWIIAMAAGLVSSIALAAQTLSIDSIAGVYKHTFDNSDVEGEHYRSENSLEIVKVTPSRAHLRVHLEFFNGHSCEIDGPAAVEGEQLVYRSEGLAGKACVLSLGVQSSRVVLHDADNGCLNYCGMRGSWEGAGFDLADRRSTNSRRQVSP